MSQFIDGEELELQFGVFRAEFILEVIEEAELAPTDPSRGVHKVPTAHFFKVITWRNHFFVGRRVGIPVHQCKV